MYFARATLFKTDLLLQGFQPDRQPVNLAATFVNVSSIAGLHPDENRPERNIRPHDSPTLFQCGPTQHCESINA
jgi:hypothetical protein